MVATAAEAVVVFNCTANQITSDQAEAFLSECSISSCVLSKNTCWTLGSLLVSTVACMETILGNLIELNKTALCQEGL